MSFHMNKIYFTFFASCLVAVMSYECVPGEKWYENCKECTCFRNGSFDCNPGPCMNNQCISGTLWFNEKQRCHCGVPGSRPHAVCVKMEYQPNLNNKPCPSFSYLYDSCSWCICDPKTNLTKCFKFEDCKKTTGGVCLPGLIKMESCYKCRCTHTRFRICTYDSDCFNNKQKPGICNDDRRTLPLHNFNLLCPFYRLLNNQQDCYADYGCPGNKKCCPTKDCYLRCVDPIY